MSFSGTKGYITKPKPGVMLNPLHPLSQGLVGCWLFNEGVGSLAYDISGHGNHGRLTNMSPNTQGSGWGGSKFGGGIEFDESSDYVDCGINANCKGQGTLGVWLKATSWPLYCGIASKGNTGAGHEINYGLWGYISGRPKVFVANNVSYQEVEYATTLNTGQWYHLLYTWDDSYIRIYLNGVLDIAPVAQTVSQVANTKELLIGAGTTAGYYFNGTIDEVRIYNRALSEHEIQTLYEDPFRNLMQVPIRRYSVEAPPTGNPYWYYQMLRRRN